MERSTTPTSGLLVAPPELSPLEQEVLDEYERLAENMKKVCLRLYLVTSPNVSVHVVPSQGYRGDLTSCSQLATQLDDLTNAPASDILDGLRELERKTSLVFTLLKASVYSIVLQQEIEWGGEPGGQ